MYYVYMVRCADGSHYTGLAKYVCRRMREHFEKTAACARYTRTHPVVALDVLFQTPTRKEAASLEAVVKLLPKKKKLELIAAPENLFAICGEKLASRNYFPVTGISLEMCLSGEAERIFSQMRNVD